jgi:hypothetical protein
MGSDPYRVLGLERGASLDEVKKAYRRLAKANHPDAAGEAALPRFLAIQAAYDQIAGPDAGSRRVVGRRPASPTGRPWEADPDRAGATHRAYGGRPRPRPGPKPGPRPRAAPRPDRGERADRPPKKATLGSTSYDDVDPETFDPDWGGASWYGTTSGTYWTLNPKEYADPRKHGPEYQARARRAGSGQPAADVPPPAEPLKVDAAEEAPSGSRAGPPPTHTTSSWWEATAGESARTDAREAGASAGAPPRPPVDLRPSATGVSGQAPGDAEGELSTDAVLASLRKWLDDDRPPIGARIGRAVVGWAPIAVGVGWGAGEISGCGRFAATCPPSVAPVTWGAQLALLALLILLPRLARVATVATIATLVTVFPASVLLFATGDPESMATARSILGGLMVVAWAAGLLYGAVREVGRRARPVS